MNFKTGVRVLLIDENIGLNLAVKLTLEEVGYEVIGSLSRGTDGIELAIQERPNIVIIGQKCVDMTGFKVCSRIRNELGTDVHCILYIDNVYLKYIDEISKHGFSASLDRSFPPKFLVYQIECVMAGLRIMSPAEYSSSGEDYTKVNRDHLTDADVVIIHYVLMGLKNAQIAEKLNMSVKTVEKHLTVLYRQFHVSRRREARNIFDSIMTGELKRRLNRILEKSLLQPEE